ncbi:MAG TPA: hypothetical protein VGZ22_18930 [Isosphaeraceae bacterium]|nr:hypothetical protein [Isosphaeraceae bacterium]
MIEEEIIEAPLRLAEKLASVLDIDWSVGITAAQAGLRVAKAMQSLEPPKASIAALSLTRVVDVVRAVRSAAENPSSERARRWIVRAAESAAKAQDRAARALHEPASTAVIEAARSDYQVLFKEFGEHEDVVLGEPIDLSEEWWREKIALWGHAFQVLRLHSINADRDDQSHYGGATNGEDSGKTEQNLVKLCEEILEIEIEIYELRDGDQSGGPQTPGAPPGPQLP